MLRHQHFSTCDTVEIWQKFHHYISQPFYSNYICFTAFIAFNNLFLIFFNDLKNIQLVIFPDSKISIVLSKTCFIRQKTKLHIMLKYH